MFNLLLLAGRSYSLTTDPNFDVISCNNEDSNLPELTLSIKKEYLDTYLSWLTTQVGFLIRGGPFLTPEKYLKESIPT